MVLKCCLGRAARKTQCKQGVPIRSAAGGTGSRAVEVQPGQGPASPRTGRPARCSGKWCRDGKGLAGFWKVLPASRSTTRAQITWLPQLPGTAPCAPEGQQGRGHPVHQHSLGFGGARPCPLSRAPSVGPSRPVCVTRSPPGGGGVSNAVSAGAAAACAPVSRVTPWSPVSR